MSLFFVSVLLIWLSTFLLGTPREVPCRLGTGHHERSHPWPRIQEKLGLMDLGASDWIYLAKRVDLPLRSRKIKPLRHSDVRGRAPTT